MTFTTQTRRKILMALAGGLTQPEAAKEAEISHRTLLRWLAKGRKATEGEFADFAAAVDAIQAGVAAREGDLTPEEHRELVAARCRRGSDAALKLYWEMNRGDEGQAEKTSPLEKVDELAKRRARA